jgi:hypothetical protein
MLVEVPARTWCRARLIMAEKRTAAIHENHHRPFLDVPQLLKHHHYDDQAKVITLVLGGQTLSAEFSEHNNKQWLLWSDGMKWQRVHNIPAALAAPKAHIGPKQLL